MGESRNRLANPRPLPPTVVPTNKTVNCLYCRHPGRFKSVSDKRSRRTKQHFSVLAAAAAAAAEPVRLFMLEITVIRYKANKPNKPRKALRGRTANHKKEKKEKNEKKRSWRTRLVIVRNAAAAAAVAALMGNQPGSPREGLECDIIRVRVSLFLVIVAFISCSSKRSCCEGARHPRMHCDDSS